LLIIIMLFRHQDALCTVGNTAPQSKVSGVTAHNLNDTAALMRGGSITNLIDRFHSCIYRSVESDRIVRTCDIKIDRSRDSDCVHSQVRQLLSSCEGTVTADNDQAV